MGFGFLLTLLAAVFPNIVEYGIFPTLFTSNVIISVVKEPTNLTKSHLPVFYPTNVVITLSVNCWSALLDLRKRMLEKKLMLEKKTD